MPNAFHSLDPWMAGIEFKRYAIVLALLQKRGIASNPVLSFQAEVAKKRFCYQLGASVTSPPCSFGRKKAEPRLRKKLRRWVNKFTPGSRRVSSVFQI
jgi:hypothetical protein